MNNIQVDNYLKLASSELKVGNYDKAEQYYRTVIESFGSSKGWLGLGAARLMKVNTNLFNNPQENERLIDSAFDCYINARELHENEGEVIETVILKSTLEYIRSYYEKAKICYDQLKIINKKETDATWLTIGAAVFKVNSLNSHL